MRQKKSTKNRDITLSSIKFFDTWNQWHPRGFPYELFPHCETKTFWQKTLIHPRVLLIHKLIRYRKLFETQLRMVPLQCFLALQDKKKSTKSRDIILLSINFLDTRNWWHPRGFPYQIFCALGDKMFSAESFDIPPVLLVYKLIRYRKLSETQLRRVPLQCFLALRDKKIHKKSWHSPLNHNFFRYPKSVTP